MNAGIDITSDVMFKLLSGEMTIADIERARAFKKQQKQRGRRQNEIEAYYTKLSTRTLLAIKNGSYWSGLPHTGDSGDWDLHWYALRKVLATREHVPRGAESKRLRQERAKAARGQGKGKNR